ERAQPCACAFTTVAMHLAYSISIIIARPFLHAVADAGVLGMHARIVRGLISIQDRTLGRHIPFNNGAGGRLVGVLQYPIAHLVAGAADQTEDRWPVVGVGALAFLLIGAPPGWIVWIGMAGTFFPPRSDTVHQLRTRSRSSARQGGCRRDWSGSAG